MRPDPYPSSNEPASAIRRKLDEARKDVYLGPEMAAVKPVFSLQAAWSRIPAQGELLIERLKSREGYRLFLSIRRRLVHEGLAALWAYRLSRLRPISFTLAVNDYGLELLSPTPARPGDTLKCGLLDADNLADELTASLNAAELAKRERATLLEIFRIDALINDACL